MRSGRVGGLARAAIVAVVALAAVVAFVVLFGDDASRPVGTSAVTPSVSPVGEVTNETADGPTADSAAAAAVRLLTEASALNADWRDVFASEVVGDPGDIAAMTADAELGEQILRENPGIADGQSVTTGHNVVVFTSLDAMVEVFVEDAVGNAQAIPVRVVWRDGRWKLVAPEGGTNMGKGRPIGDGS